MKQLSCDQCRERWDELIDKSTYATDPQFADVLAHLESCADCQKTFDLLVATRQELQQLPAQKAPASLRANILSQIENPHEQTIPWWRSFLVSPQRLAWASGAIVTVFVVALLMRPEHQTQVMSPAPEVLSNRGQVEEHNSAPPQPSVLPTKPKSDLPAEKVLPEKPRETPLKRSPAVKPQPKSSETSGTKKKSKQQQKFVTPAPESASEKTKELPAPTTNEQLSTPPKAITPPNPEPQKDTALEPHPFAAPVPANNDSAVSQSNTKEATGAPKLYSQNPSNQQDSTNRSMAKGARGPERPTRSIQPFKSQNTHPIIHWSKTITSDYDVANAKITMILGDDLTFAGENSKIRERTLWQGTLYRGKKIPLDVDLQRTPKETAKLHLLMINTDTQKVLLDKILDVK